MALSLGRTGQCWDNALAESFFASFKGELIDTRPWATRAAARRAIVEYIEGLHNGAAGCQPPRLPQTPTEFENIAIGLVPDLGPLSA